MGAAAYNRGSRIASMAADERMPEGKRPGKRPAWFPVDV